MRAVNRGHRGVRAALLSALALLALVALACGEVARPGDPAPSPTEPIVVNAEGVPGAAGSALGPYTPNSDVSFEVRTNASIEQLSGLLVDPGFVDWDSVRESFEGSPAAIGEVVPPSLAAVTASAATGPIGAAYIERFGSEDWLHARALDAITGTGQFADSSAIDRVAGLSNLITIELPMLRALVAAEAGERLTAAGDLDARFGAPHEWDRLWVIIQGSPTLSAALTEGTLAAILAGHEAAIDGDAEAAADAHDTVRVALLRTALEAMASADSDRANAFLRAVEPLLMRVDPAATRDLATLLEPTVEDITAPDVTSPDVAPSTRAIRGVVARLANSVGIEEALVFVES